MAPAREGQEACVPLSVSHDGDDNRASMRITPMLEQKNALPGAKLNLSADDRNRFTRPGQNHSNM